VRLKLETKLGTGARLWSEGDTYRSTSAEDHFPAPTPTPTPTPAPAANLVWRQCALPGKLCDCGVQGAGAKVIRYGAPGDATTNPAVRRWDYAHMEDRGEAVLLCDPLSFLHRDPFPGHAKHCDCAYLPGQQLPPVATPPLGLGNLAPSVPPGRGLHSFTLELNLSNSRTYSSVQLGHTVDRRAQVELKSERG
jgi:hypothetical protein